MKLAHSIQLSLLPGHITSFNESRNTDSVVVKISSGRHYETTKTEMPLPIPFPKMNPQPSHFPDQYAKTPEPPIRT